MSEHAQQTKSSTDNTTTHNITHPLLPSAVTTADSTLTLPIQHQSTGTKTFHHEKAELVVFHPPEHVTMNPQPQQHRPVELSRRSTILEEGPIAEPVNTSSFICGLLAGIAQAGVFNPYDRALYLSVKDSRPFLHPTNWSNPYTGFLQSISGRAIQGGLYFPLEHFFLHHFNEAYYPKSQIQDGDPALNFLAGTAAGAVNAVLLNPISAVKYKTWGREVNYGVFHEVYGMIRKSGFSIRPFYNGLIPTVMRDVVFGGTYTWLRLQIKVWFSLSNSEQWIGNFVAAGLATILSGPFNYVRTIQFGTRSHEIAPTMISILTDLSKETMSQPNDTLLSRIHFLQNKFRIGWGTARVAIGMTFAHAVYNWLHDKIKPQYFEPTTTIKITEDKHR